mgnify:CR=1 FL=1
MGLAFSIAGAGALLVADEAPEDVDQGVPASPAPSSALQTPSQGGMDESPSPSSQTSLLYVERGWLMQAGLGQADNAVRVLRVGTAQVAASPDGGSVALVVERGSPRDSDFGDEPHVVLVDLATEDRVNLGPGFAPMWSPGGTRLAFLRPVEDRECFSETCLGEAELVVADRDGSAKTLTEPGSWGVLGWVGDEVVVSHETGSPETMKVAIDGRRQVLELSPSSFWGTSPDGRWIVSSDDGEVVIHPISTEGVLGAPSPINTSGRSLGAGAWSPDSSMLAGVLVGESLIGRDNVIAAISPTAPIPTTVKGSRGAIGQVLWVGPSEIIFVSMQGRAVVVRRCEVPHGPCDDVSKDLREVSLVGIR